MDFRPLIQKNMPSLVKDLQGCIQIPSLYQDDDSGYPYGKPVQECLEYMLALADGMGFATANMDNQLGWCEYGQGEEMVAVLGTSGKYRVAKSPTLDIASSNFT